jgi:hypothetical protein
MENVHQVRSDRLVDQLKSLVQTERKITARILSYINEIERRKLFLHLGHTSMFAFLTGELGYTKAAAQRRLDSARLLREMPEIKTPLESGELNLSQTSILAHSIRQKLKEDPQIHITTDMKRELLDEVKGKDLELTQTTIAKRLNLRVIAFERKRIQQDESVRMELTFTKEQMATLNHAKNLLSHVHANPSMADLITLLAGDVIKRRDPALKKATKSSTKIKDTGLEAGAAVQPTSSSATELKGRIPISAATRRLVFQRDGRCRWVDPSSGRGCDSRFQLQIDHIVPVWRGGGNEPGNLQLLCRAHNVLKYEVETGQRSRQLLSAR